MNTPSMCFLHSSYLLQKERIEETVNTARFSCMNDSTATMMTTYHFCLVAGMVSSPEEWEKRQMWSDECYASIIRLQTKSMMI